MVTAADQGGLFDVPELVPLPNARRAEAGVHRALQAGEAAHLVGPTDAALAAGALILARALDRAEAIRDDKASVYAVAQAFPPFQRALHGLRLPAEVTPVTESPAPDPTPAEAGGPSWLRDEFGPS